MKKSFINALFLVVLLLNSKLAMTQTVIVPASTACKTPPDEAPNKPTSIDCDHFGTAIVDVTLPDGSVWMDRNMGALRAATYDEDLMSFGCLYQYGRKPDGHQATHYYQPQNWGYGYPTLGMGPGAPDITKPHLAGGATSKTFLANGYAIYPSPFTANPTAYSTAEVVPTTSSTYTNSANSTGLNSNVMITNPTQDWAPGAARYYKSGFYNWYGNTTDYPCNTWMPKLWGGNTNYPGVYKSTNPVFGTELNPVCPTGYHVPTRDEWLSAIYSIQQSIAPTAGAGIRATTYNSGLGSWSQTVLKLPIATNDDGNSSGFYWTSSPNNGGSASTASNMFIVAFPNYRTTNTGYLYDVNVGDKAVLAASNWTNANTPSAASAQPQSGLAYLNMYVRCRKN